MSDKQRAQLAMMLRTGMMSQEDYNETIAAMDVKDAGKETTHARSALWEKKNVADNLSAAMYKVSEQQSPTTLTCPNCGIPVQPEWKACPQCGTSLDGHLSYEDWLAQVNTSLMQLGGYNLKHAKEMYPGLDMQRLFPDPNFDGPRWSPEETAQDIISVIEDKY